MSKPLINKAISNTIGGKKKMTLRAPLRACPDLIQLKKVALALELNQPDTLGGIARKPTRGSQPLGHQVVEIRRTYGHWYESRNTHLLFFLEWIVEHPVRHGAVAAQPQLEGCVEDRGTQSI
jgi:hypothetical protein